jgi:hypothetical protein
MNPMGLLISKDQQVEKNEQTTKISLAQIHMPPLKVSQQSLSAFDPREIASRSHQFLDARRIVET